MIGYQVPVTLRKLSPVAVFEEGVTNFLAAGIFAYLAFVEKPVSSDLLCEITDCFSEVQAIDEALEELADHGLITEVEIATSADEIASLKGGAA